MSKSKIHTVILHPQYAADNWSWLQRFVLQSPSKTMYIFACNNIQDSHFGMTEFQGVMTKSNDEKENILLPSHVIVGVFLDQHHKHPLGFLNQEEFPEQ